MIWKKRTPAAPEAKSLANPSPDLSEIFGIQATSNGLNVSAAQAIAVPAVSACISVIAETAASLPVKVKRIDADGIEHDAPDHPVAALLAGDVNDWMAFPAFVADTVSTSLTRSEGATAYIGRDGIGRAAELIPYRPGVMAVTFDAATGEPTFSLNGTVIPSRDVLWLPAPLGRSPLARARGSVSIAAVMSDHCARLFARGARPSGTLNFAKGMGEDLIKKTIAGWRAAHEGPDAGGKTAILADGAEFRPLALSAVDAQFLELWQFTVTEICRAFRVPPSMIYQLDRATWSNSEQMGREFLTYTLEPWLLALEAALRRALFLPDERRHFAIRFDRDDLTRADLTARATAINSLIAS